MTPLILGLVLFLGAHSTRILAPDWRDGQVARLGENRWKGIYSVVSLLGFGLVVWGYGLSRGAPAMAWAPAPWTNHLTSLLTLPAFILLVAAYVPGTHIKAAVGHPMVAGTALWALAHLVSNGRAGDLLLFGTFLVWAVVDFQSARRRDRAAHRRYPVAGWGRDAIAVVAGVVAWGVFAAFLHERLIGVRPY